MVERALYVSLPEKLNAIYTVTCSFSAKRPSSSFFIQIISTFQISILIQVSQHIISISV